MEPCPLHCIKSGCPSEPDFLQKHDSFILTLCGVLGGGAAVVLTYFLKSRCKKIKCCGVECDRSPVQLNTNEVVVTH